MSGMAKQNISMQLESDHARYHLAYIHFAQCRCTLLTRSDGMQSEESASASLDAMNKLPGPKCAPGCSPEFLDSLRVVPLGARQHVLGVMRVVPLGACQHVLSKPCVLFVSCPSLVTRRT